MLHRTHSFFQWVVSRTYFFCQYIRLVLSNKICVRVCTCVWSKWIVFYRRFMYNMNSQNSFIKSLNNSLDEVKFVHWPLSDPRFWLRQTKSIDRKQMKQKRIKQNKTKVLWTTSIRVKVVVYPKSPSFVPLSYSQNLTGIVDDHLRIVIQYFLIFPFTDVSIGTGSFRK